jgi:type IV pilus assembly protein PilE
MKKSKKIPKGRLKALTLMEVLIALVIIGILTLMVLPNHNSTIAKAKAVEAKLQLEHLLSLEKEYFYTYSKYTSDPGDIGFEQQKLVTGGGNANYQVEIISATPGAFKARATAVVDFDQDGTFNTWEIDQEKNLTEVTKD